MKRLMLAGVLAAATALPATVASANGDEAAIRAASVQLMESYAAGDAAAMAALYTRDAALLPPGTPRVDGRQAIQAYWQGAMDSGISDLILNTTEIEDDDDLAYETGTFSLSMPAEDGSRTTLTGKYLVVWEEDDDVWMLHRDIWNLDPASAE